MLNYFNFAYATRTFSNNLEALLTMLAIQVWPIIPSPTLTKPSTITASSTRTLSSSRLLDKHQANLMLGLLFVGLAIWTRPSALTHWIVPLLATFLRQRGFIKKINFIWWGILAAVSCVALGISIDRLFYGQWTVSGWNFIKFNIVHRVSDYYGIYPWYYYLAGAIPAYLGSMLPLVIITLSNWEPQIVWLVQFLIGSLTLNSLVPHKELRFLYPVMPILMIMAGQGYNYLNQRIRLTGKWEIIKRCYLIILLLSNLVVGIYLARIHKIAPRPLMDYLRDEVDRGQVRKIYFAMTCHSTPFYGYLHRTIPMEFITCEPPLNHHGALEEYVNEGNKFDKDPVGYLQSHLPPDTSHLVMSHWINDPTVKEYIKKQGFTESKRFVNQFWDFERRKSEEFIVLYR